MFVVAAMVALASPLPSPWEVHVHSQLDHLGDDMVSLVSAAEKCRPPPGSHQTSR